MLNHRLGFFHKHLSIHVNLRCWTKFSHSTNKAYDAKSMLKPIISQLGHVQQYLISALVGDTTGHNPRWCSLEELLYQLQKILQVLFGLFTSSLFLFPLITLGENYCHWDLKQSTHDITQNLEKCLHKQTGNRHYFFF